MYVYLVLGAVMLLRGWELAVSALRLRRASQRATGSAMRERTYPLMVLLHAGWLAGCWAEALLAPQPYRAAVVLPALLLWIASLLLRAWMMRALGVLWNVRVVRRPRQPVVKTGPYRWVRHPNYLAVVLELAAVPLAVGAPWTALLASLANIPILIWRIRAEEAYLFSLPGYAEAFAHKKRFLPGLF